MRKLTLLLTFVLLLSSCYKDEIDDLNKKFEDLKKEQMRQAELLATYQSLIEALENKLTITSIVPQGDGYKISFSDGTHITIENGEDGHTPLITIGENGNWFIDGVDTGNPSAGKAPTLTIVDGYWYIDGVSTGIKAQGVDGEDAPSIISIVDIGGTIIFYMSDGTTITMGKKESVGMFVLSEGSMGKGNGQLVYFGYDSEKDKFIRDDDKRFQNYGETPNDLVIYGSKMYCAITGDATSGGIVRVINPNSGQTIENIVISMESKNLQPRRLTAKNGKVFVTLYSGAVAQIDTASFSTEVTKLSGAYSEGICTHGEYLYICNSGQGEDNTLSVVSIAEFEEKESITVPYNPVNIVDAGNGQLYLNTASVWSGAAAGEPANLHIFDPSTKKVTHTFDIEVESISAGKKYIYGTATNWSTYGGILKKVSIVDKSVSDFTTSTSKLMLAYKITVNPLTGEVFVTQQMGQDINRFKEDGTHIETLKAGQQNGTAVAFVNAVN